MVQSISFKGSHLDKLLAEGKYRMNNQMTTCDYIITENVELLNVIWARYLVYEVKDLLKHKIYKNAKKFKVTITDFVLTDEIKTLAQKYCDSRKIEVTFEKQLESKMYSDYEDQFQWFLGAALLFLAIESFLSERISKLWKKLNLFNHAKA